MADIDGLSLEEKYQALLLQQTKFETENQKLRFERDELNDKVQTLTKTVEMEKSKFNTKEKREAWDEIYV